MNKQLNLQHKIGTGITPQQFIGGMTRNQEELIHWYTVFTWENKEEKNFFDAFKNRNSLYSLILCTDWCPDVIWNVPVLLHANERSQIPTEILLMEEHLETMDLFLTDGGRNQPIAVYLDPNGNVLGKWGARPAYIQKFMDEFRKENPDRNAAGYQEKVFHKRREIAAIYKAGTEYQDVIIKELHQLFSSFLMKEPLL
ncbi:thioredoxin family protein [Bacillus sp. REN3]|uniref:thioredoxin family protein n=1 Tax=Bacillus sp. REN3 TaxID=2802440 RepID=UPI001AEE1969|nr:thioredoxin family protein [Bacillus sp. REN3]